ncbi:hypothetical protein AB1283_03015 [Bacillus sp. S13(2024)]
MSKLLLTSNGSFTEQIKKQFLKTFETLNKCTVVRVSDSQSSLIDT